MQTVTLPKRTPSYAEIAQQAYLIWEAEGRPEDRAVRHWLDAEAQLMATQLHTIAADNPVATKPSSPRSRYGLVLAHPPAGEAADRRS